MRSHCAAANSVLYFPQGHYLISNASNDPSLIFSDLTDFEIAGGGSTLLFDGAATGISSAKINGLRVHDLAFDWKRPSFSQGKITNLSADGLTAAITIAPEYPLTGLEPARLIHFFDPSTNAPIRTPRLLSIQYSGAQTFQARFDQPLRATAATVVVLHGRSNKGILLEQSQQITFSAVQVFAAPGMAIAGGEVRDLTLDHCQVVPRPGSGRMLSSGADGFNLWDSSGTVTVTNCEFAATGDDCINVHAFFLAATAESASTIEIAPSNQINGKPRPLADALLPTSGETIEIVDPRDFAPLADAKVDHLDRVHNERLVTTTQPLALEPGQAVLIDDFDRTPAKLEIRNCYFRNTPSRGILATPTLPSWGI